MIKLFYHLALMNNWRDITRFFLDSIVSSGLYDRCSSFDVVFVGEGDPLDEFSGLSKVSVCRGGNLEDFEFPTLKKLYESSSLSTDAFLLYLHSKGASFDLDRWNIDKETIIRQYRNRRYETYEDVQRAYRSTRYWNRRAIIEGHEDCVGFLGDNDIVCLKRRPDSMFIPSNMWWARSSYIRGLDPPSLKKDRYDADMWTVNRMARVKTIVGFDDEYRRILFQ